MIRGKNTQCVAFVAERVQPSGDNPAGGEMSKCILNEERAGVYVAAPREKDGIAADVARTASVHTCEGRDWSAWEGRETG